MTDPNPTRAEVERFGCDQLGMDKMPDGEWVRFTDYAALRDRAEAAEAERIEVERAFSNLDQKRKVAEFECGNNRAKLELAKSALTAARRAEAAAWNDAIEAAYQACLTCDGALNNAGAAAVKVRALRRAVPVEGDA